MKRNVKLFPFISALKSPSQRKMSQIQALVCRISLLGFGRHIRREAAGRLQVCFFYLFL